MRDAAVDTASMRIMPTDSQKGVMDETVGHEGRRGVSMTGLCPLLREGGTGEEGRQRQ